MLVDAASDPFADYGSTAAPTPMDRRHERPMKAPTALDKKFAEKQRLAKAYTISQRKYRAEMFALEPRLFDMLRWLRRQGPDDGDEIVEGVRDSWLPEAPYRVRCFALELVHRQCQRVRASLGLAPLDDPIPPETAVFQEVQRLIIFGRPIA